MSSTSEILVPELRRSEKLPVSFQKDVTAVLTELCHLEIVFSS